MRNPNREHPIYLYGVCMAAVVLSISVLVGERRIRTRPGVDSTGSVDPMGQAAQPIDAGDTSVRNNQRLDKALGELVEEAKAFATARGVYTEVGSRERIDAMERREEEEEERVEDWPNAGPSTRSVMCQEDSDCHYPHGVCDVSRGSCRCVVAYAGVQCDRVVHVQFPASLVFGKMLPLDVLVREEDDLYEVWEDDQSNGGLHPVEQVSERCVVSTRAADVAAVRQSEVGREIERRLVGRFGARQLDTASAIEPKSKAKTEAKPEETARGLVVALLEAMRRCMAVRVEGGDDKPGSRPAIRLLMEQLRYA